MGLHDIARSRGYNQDVEVLNPNHNEQAKASYNIPRSISGNALASLIAEQEAATEVPVTKENAMRKLNCKAQNYAWGRMGRNSTVANMSAAQNEEFEIQDDKPYAELWIGTHPNGMSNICSTGSDEDEDGESFMDDGITPMSLLEHVQSNPKLHLGSDTKTDLTFLFKILSIEKVLSIQAHPDKKLAEQLHTSRPHVYKDPNHKPEMAVALTNDFEAMCGFRPVNHIAENLKKYPEFWEVIGQEAAENVLALEHNPNSSAIRGVLRNMFHKFNTADDELIQRQLTKLIGRLRLKQLRHDELSRDAKLMLKLADQFPGDSGMMAPLMLNHVRLTRGQSFYIGANEPHAYISGEIIECMACSDNVVRAGLTPKLKDVDTLVSMLTYRTAVPTITRGKKIDDCTTLYAPPVADFCIEIIDVPAYSNYELKPVRSPSVVIILDGDAKFEQGNVTSLIMTYGGAIFISANTRTGLRAGTKGISIARAMSNVHFY